MTAAKPTRLKLISGNPGGRPINKEEPQPEIRSKVPRAPSHMTPKAKKFWKKMAPQMHAIGLLTKVDETALEALCEKGLCQKIVTGSGVARFDADVSRHLHVVSNDGNVVDVPEDLAEKISDSLPLDLSDQLAGLCECGKASHLTIQLNN